MFRKSKGLKLTKEEEAHIEEVMLFNRAGIKVCVFSRMGGCEGDVITIYRDPEYDEEGNRVKYGIQMNVCEVHKGDEPGWKVEYGPDSDSEDGIA